MGGWVVEVVGVVVVGGQTRRTRKEQIDRTPENGLLMLKEEE